MTLLFAGDYYPNRRVASLIENNEAKVIAEDIRGLVSSADYSIFNYESPIVLRPDCKPIAKAGPNLKSTVNAARYIKAVGFKMATLANNHIMDYGGDALVSTKEILEDLQLDTIGAGKNLAEASTVVYRKICGTIIAFINCCEHEFSIASETKAGANPLNPISQFYAIKEAKAKADYVIVIVHGGMEHFQLPSQRMVDTYRFFIDVGANVVVNHHQHCYSGYEEYNEGLVFYGLGNLCFDSFKAPLSPEIGLWNEGYMVLLDFCQGKMSFKLYPYIQCAQEPTVELMRGDPLNSFRERLSEINRIILNPRELKKCNESWMSETYLQQQTVVLPYPHHYLVSAANRGWIPKGLNKDRVARLLNKVDCESHRDRLVFYLKHILKDFEPNSSEM